MMLANPWWLLGLFVLPLMVLSYRHRKPGTFLFPGMRFFKTFPESQFSWRKICLILRMLAVAFLFIAMARPQLVSESQEVHSQGIDIMLALDISGSMRALDFKPLDRLDAAKEVIHDFIAKRKTDRIGAVIFAAHSYTQCPLTTDYDVVLNLLDQVKIGMIEDGTAIGMALATAVKRIKDSEAKSKVIILLTDGVNNKGEIDPLTAANLAKSFGIKVYTICIGKNGKVPYPVMNPLWGRVQYQMVKIPIDEDTLKKIAEITDARYYRAEDKQTLKEVYDQIDRLEKTEVYSQQYYQYEEYFWVFVILSFMLLLFECFIRCVWKISLP